MTVGRRRLMVLHWFPLEQFPPAQNFLSFVGRDERFKTICCSTKGTSVHGEFRADGVVISRSRFPNRALFLFKRLWCFLAFPLLCVWKAFFFRPEAVFYYEPHSALAAFGVLMVCPHAQLVIHYHEYRESRHLLDRGNFLARCGFWIERRFLFRRATWVSQTNTERVEFFLKDVPEVSRGIMRTMPNFPPSEWRWQIQEADRPNGTAIRLVYVGAISLHDTYIEEVLTWIKQFHPSLLQLDLFISSIDPATEAYLKGVRIEGLTVHFGGVPYSHLPRVLSGFDVGLILYRCTTINYVFNAPNKLFEYLNCGLNVLYPTQMQGVQPYQSMQGSPWVRPVDYTELSQLPITDWRRVDPQSLERYYACEEVYQPFLNFIMNGGSHLNG